MLGGVDSWEDTGISGILGDPDDDQNSWRSVPQGISRAYEEDVSDQDEGVSESRDLDYWEPEEKGSSGAGLDRGFNPQKDTLRNRQSIREKRRYEQEVW
ncbi:MAG: hypothetical protein MUP63_01390 [Candidatus Nanohaloarchaeota archaeon QJJ-7]|nr:hypothetical protein [Candidatus Nanohaloarchaeota archaeon QJJ-7]